MTRGWQRRRRAGWVLVFHLVKNMFLYFPLLVLLEICFTFSRGLKQMEVVGGLGRGL